MLNLLVRDRQIQNLLWAGTFAATVVLGHPTVAQASGTSTEAERSPQTYLYGEQPQPGQVGATYLVVELEGTRAVGALYQPDSEFECFTGELQAERLAMTFLDFNSTGTDTPQTWDYAVAIAPATLVASRADLPANMPQFIGFHPLNTLSERDRDLLATCQRVMNSAQ